MTRGEFESRITSLENRIVNLENNIDTIISDYISTVPMMFEAGEKIAIDKNLLNNKYTISYSLGYTNIELSILNTTIWSAASITGTIKGTTLEVNGPTGNTVILTTVNMPTITLSCVPSPEWSSANVTTSAIQCVLVGIGVVPITVARTRPDRLDLTLNWNVQSGTQCNIIFTNFEMTF
ncbi:MAG: hypothetical protein Q4F88_07040 [Eubacteriales bacterium]|nr:hypothetical protein [Eubacteriales bacterium]